MDIEPKRKKEKNEPVTEEERKKESSHDVRSVELALQRRTTRRFIGGKLVFVKDQQAGGRRFDDDE